MAPRPAGLAVEPETRLHLPGQPEAPPPAPEIPALGHSLGIRDRAIDAIRPFPPSIGSPHLEAPEEPGTLKGADTCEARRRQLKARCAVLGLAFAVGVV